MLLLRGNFMPGTSVGQASHDDSELVQSHCSGHSKGQDLLDIVPIVDAKMLFPVHTVHPEAYRKVSKNMTIIKEGTKYTL